MTTTVYTFDNSAAEAADQLASLQTFLDPITTARIADLDLPAGARCWEIGAGAGSVAAWLAEHVGPAGHVVATDINTSRLDHLAERGNATVVEHDVATMSLPDDDGPYDLIHARLVLLHLERREQILLTLANSLAPGGWLLLEEFDCAQPLTIHTTRSEDDADLFGRVTGAIIDILESNGADMGWAQRVHATMVDAGLADVHTITHSESWQGGSVGARLHAANTRQLAHQLHGAGLTDDELERFRDIVDDQAHTAASYQFVSTRGRRPSA